MSDAGQRAREPCAPAATLPGPPRPARCALDVAAARRRRSRGKRSSSRGPPASSARSRCRCCSTPPPAPGGAVPPGPPGAAPPPGGSPKVAPSEAFDPLRARHGAAFEAFLREEVRRRRGRYRIRCSALSGAVRRARAPRAARRDHQQRRPGVVRRRRSRSRSRSTRWAPERARARRRKGGALVHVSTCFVAGNRDGEVWEDEPVVGYFPRARARGAPRRAARRATSIRAETPTARRSIDRGCATQADDGQPSRCSARSAPSAARSSAAIPTTRTISSSRSRASASSGSTRAHEARHGARRHWGWTNTYTYTKSLGEQLIARPDGAGDDRGGRRSSRARCATRSRAGTRGSTRPRRWCTWCSRATAASPWARTRRLDVIPVDFIAAACCSRPPGLVAPRARAGLPARRERRGVSPATGDADRARGAPGLPRDKAATGGTLSRAARRATATWNRLAVAWSAPMFKRIATS